MMKNKDKTKQYEGMIFSKQLVLMLQVLGNDCDEDLWWCLMTAYLSDSYISMVPEFAYLLYQHAKIVRRECLFTAGYIYPEGGHAMLALVKYRSRSSDTFNVKLFNTGSGCGHHLYYCTETERLEHQLPYAEYNMKLEDIKGRSYFNLECKTNEEALEKMYPKKQSVPKMSGCMSYMLPQRSGTCAATVLYSYLRTLGLRGYELEILMKKRLIELMLDGIKSKDEAWKDIIDNKDLFMELIPSCTKELEEQIEWISEMGHKSEAEKLTLLMKKIPKSTI